MAWAFLPLPCFLTEATQRSIFGHSALGTLE